MSYASRHLTVSAPRYRLVTSAVSTYGRSTPYRQLFSALQHTNPRSDQLTPFIITQYAQARPLAFLRSTLHPNLTRLTTTRSFFSRPAAHAEHGDPNDVKDPPRKNHTSPDKTESEFAKASSEKSQESSQSKQEGNGDEAKNDTGKEKEKEKKSEPPPPPPHGDKTPWQVFTETLRTEFKASKEWNESTKALASSAHQFTENESVKRARAAYSAASGTAASTTSSALKGTGKVIGKTAAWTWETPVVKGVRAGVNATGKGIDKVTKPVRETAAFKSVKEVIDDGSSSRYGGWTEKEERRKKRELRELRESQASGRPGRRIEKIEEDPKYVGSLVCLTPFH